MSDEKEGLQFLHGQKRMAVIDGEIVPGRNLTTEEVKRYGRKELIDTGLYQPFPESSSVKRGNENGR